MKIIWGIFWLGLIVLIKLGFWQLSRMEEKIAIAIAWDEAIQSPPIPLTHILSGAVKPRAFQAVELPDMASIKWQDPLFLLDNQPFQKQMGYRLFRSAMLRSDKTLLLIEDRWLSYDEARQRFKHTSHQNHREHMTLSRIGYVRFPAKGFTLGTQSYETPVQWPLILQWMDSAALSHLLNQPVAPFWIQWEKPVLPALTPEKHLMYAGQWFLFASLWGLYGGMLIYRHTFRSRRKLP